jgi:hypothetical protein
VLPGLRAQLVAPFPSTGRPYATTRHLSRCCWGCAPSSKG